MDTKLENLNRVMRIIVSATEQAIEQMEVGSRTNLKCLNEKVSSFVGLPQTVCLPFVSTFVKNYERCWVQKGRNGGIYKGTRPIKHLNKPCIDVCDKCNQPIVCKVGQAA